MYEREVVTERPAVEREVVIDERRDAPIVATRRQGGVLAAVAAILLVLVLGWFLFNIMGTVGEAAEEIEIPEGNAQVEVDG